MLSVSYCYEIESQYATIYYERAEYPEQFIDAIVSGGSSRFSINTTLTAREVVIRNVDELVEKVKRILNLFPEELDFAIVLLRNSDDVRRIYKARYCIDTRYISFYALEDRTIFVSVSDATVRVLAHEITHVVIDHAFRVAPSVEVHESLAQFVETHIEY
jgi:hypothetical protein